MPILIVPLALAVYSVSDTWEQRVRFTGLGFELLGLWIVADGLRETNSLLRPPSPRTALAKYWANRPRWRPVVHNISGSIHAQVAAMGGEFHAKTTLAADATVQQWMAHLKQSVDELDDGLRELRQKFNTENASVHKAIEVEVGQRAAEVADVRSLVTSAVAGRIHLEWVGLLYLLCGLILSNASPEIAQLFGCA